MKPLLISTQAYAPLANRLANLVNADCGTLDLQVFPDGERYMRIMTDVRERDVILLGGSYDDA